jgi:hypothetical protein
MCSDFGPTRFGVLIEKNERLNEFYNTRALNRAWRSHSY